jgi:hypothetical protein
MPDVGDTNCNKLANAIDTFCARKYSIINNTPIHFMREAALIYLNIAYLCNGGTLYVSFDLSEPYEHAYCFSDIMLYQTTRRIGTTAPFDNARHELGHHFTLAMHRHDWADCIRWPYDPETIISLDCFKEFLTFALNAVINNNKFVCPVKYITAHRACRFGELKDANPCWLFNAFLGKCIDGWCPSCCGSPVNITPGVP